jgi:hypothetical protein
MTVVLTVAKHSDIEYLTVNGPSPFIDSDSRRNRSEPTVLHWQP